eukprot:3251433-Rhodomonas_salina.1
MALVPAGFDGRDHVHFRLHWQAERSPYQAQVAPSNVQCFGRPVLTRVEPEGMCAACLCLLCWCERAPALRCNHVCDVFTNRR